MRGRRLALLGMAAAAAAMAGCAALAPPEPARVSGRLSVQVAAHGDRPAHGVSAGFELDGDASDGALRLNNPLGMQVAAARWRPGEARLATTQGETRFDTLDALAREALGEPVPLQALPDWLRGRPWPGAEHTTVAQGFVQLGWTIDLTRWSDGLVAATRTAPPSVTVRARVDRPA